MQRFLVKFTSVFALALAAVAMQAGLIWAQEQEPVRVERIRENPETFRNEVVTVEGRVTQYVERPGSTTSFYFLQDDWGSLLQVRTSGDLPETGERFRITGAVSFDRRVEPYITEEVRTALGAGSDQSPGGPSSGDAELGGAATSGSESPGAGQSAAEGPEASVWWQNSWILAAAGLLLIFFIYNVGQRLLRRAERQRASQAGVGTGTTARSSAGQVEGDGARAGPSHEMPEPAEVVQGKTVRFEAPPPGTLKLLPGRLELIAGDDDVEEVRFFAPGRDDTPEFTFGRDSGPRYTHIQLDAPTVSREHAKITFSDGTPRITNLSATNPTRVNEIELEKKGDSTRLEDGDVIDMGEIRFRYEPR